MNIMAHNQLKLSTISTLSLLSSSQMSSEQTVSLTSSLLHTSLPLISIFSHSTPVPISTTHSSTISSVFKPCLNAVYHSKLLYKCFIFHFSVFLLGHKSDHAKQSVDFKIRYPASQTSFGNANCLNTFDTNHTHRHLFVVMNYA